MINAQEIQGQWNTLRGKVKEKWGQLTNDDLQLAHGNVDQLIGRIQQKTGESRKAIQEFISNLMPEQSTISQGIEAASEYVQGATEAIRGGYEQASEAVAEGYGQVAEQARQGYRQAERLVIERPAASLGTLFGTGLILGCVVGCLMHSDHSSSDSWLRW